MNDFWQMPQSAVQATGQNKKELPTTSKNIGDVVDFKKKTIGKIFELKTTVDKGSDTLSVDIFVPGINKSDYSVITSGWHTWSGSETRGKDVGIGEFDSKFSKNKTEFVVEPGKGNLPVEDSDGVSYGLVVFREKRGNKNIGVGIIPSLKEIEDIRFRLTSEGVVVTLRKNLEGLIGDREVTFKVFLSEGMFTEIFWRFGEELSKLDPAVVPTKDRIIWFSWAAYGKGVRQERDIEPELPYISEVGADSIIIDDGWETVIGQWQVDTDKFPELIGLIENIKKMGLKPGLWVAPFMVMRETEIFNLHPEWITKDKDGNILDVSNPQIQPTGRLRPFVEKAAGLDISIPEIREYIYAEFVRLAKMGFEIFKVDFISIPFVGELTNKDRTSVEYYRLFFKELRSRVNKETGKNIEFIGCGAPMMESIGLFEGIRVSADSAMPNIETLRYYGRLFRIFNAIPLIGNLIRKKITSVHSVMYRDAAAVAFRRALLFGRAHGLFVDGVHLNDPKVYINDIDKKKLTDALPAFKKLGLLTNIFIGDSFVRSGLGGRTEWKEFINKFKKGEKAWIDEQTGGVYVSDKI